MILDPNSDRDRAVVDHLINVAKARYRVFKNEFPKGITISEEAFVVAYGIAHRDVMEMMAKVLAGQQVRI